MLTKKYKNDWNEGLTYITLSGDALPLTPAMVLDWARAMEEGQALLNMPPNIPSFNPKNKVQFLHPARKAQALNTVQSPAQNSAMPNINSITSVILLQTLANLSQPTGLPHSPNIPALPTTPVRRASERSTSPPVLSPSQLMQFLKYAEMELHIVNATTYEQRLAVQHIRPDIFAKIDDKTLIAEIRIPTGDIIHLKKGSTVWWNGLDAKQKRSDMGQSQSKSPAHWASKRITYEKKYHNGGGCHFTGPPMIAGDDDGPPKDYDLWCQSTDHGAWLPAPQGFIVCKDEDKDNLDLFFK
ncbi:hypothetical protein JVU11DRAFT_2155 [Chiua virens]|nr:hypothetical protein JVU11DRAFT_2155 [Chiua virens]